MSKLVFILLIFLLVLDNVLTFPVYASDVSPFVYDTGRLTEPPDMRVAILHDYLSQYNSPLLPNAIDFIQSADMYSLDWKLVVSIAGVESTFGRFVPGDQSHNPFSYNAWGWGVYQHQVINFNSWKDGIYAVSKGLRAHYLNKGLIDPSSISNQYASDPNWSTRVNYFIDDLTSYTQNYLNPNKLTLISPKQQDVTQRIFLEDAYLKVEGNQFKLIFVAN